MSKRELGKLASVVDVDAPRAKRRKEAAPQEEKKPPEADMDVDVTGEGNGKREQEDDPAKVEQVKEQGLKLWQTVKDAVDKDGRSLSADFLRLPNKRMYPDYYTVIKKPIALDKIKSQLDTGVYQSLIAVKNDLEQCFRNAKRYNLKESQIFNDAKFLHKLTSREYVNMTGDTKDEAEHNEDPLQEDGHESGLKDGGDDEPKKKKVMARLLTARLDKLVAKKDDGGNTLSNDFMELPNKKIWAIYYKTISRPMSFEKIYKHLKRKEYSNAAQFAQDVELVFSNAMQFNEDHTPLWEAARQLKEYFAKLMADLPAPYTVPQYAPKDPPRQSNGKIRLRVPLTQQSPLQASTSTTAASPPRANTPLVLKVPAKETPAQAPASSSPVAGPSSASSPQLPHPPVPARNATGSPAQPAVQTPARAPTPALRSLALTITPTHRRLALDARDGVRSWSLRLAPSERGLRVSDVRLFRSADSDDENDGSEEEEDEEEEEEEEDEDEDAEEEEDDEEGDGTSNGATDATRVRKEERVGRVKKPPPLRVLLDRTEVECRGRGQWEVALGPGAGARVLELSDVRAGDGDPKSAWRVYLHCTA